jgi:hypothetical protein
MKIKTAISKQEDQPIFVFSIGVWQAAGWKLSGCSLAEEIVKRAYAAAGESDTNPMIQYTSTFKGAPDWAYVVELKESHWKECI